MILVGLGVVWSGYALAWWGAMYARGYPITFLDAVIPTQARGDELKKAIAWKHNGGFGQKQPKAKSPLDNSGTATGVPGQIPMGPM